MVRSTRGPRNDVAAPRPKARPALGLRRQAPGLYGGHQIQRFLDLDWVKIAHSVTKDIFPREGQGVALHAVESPATPLSYGMAKEYVLLKYGQAPEGRAKESLGSTLADYIWTEISVRAGNVHGLRPLQGHQ